MFLVNNYYLVLQFLHEKVAEEQAAGIKPSRSGGYNDGPSSSSADSNAMSLRLPGEHGLISGDDWNALYGYVEKR